MESAPASLGSAPGTGDNLNPQTRPRRLQGWLRRVRLRLPGTLAVCAILLPDPVALVHPLERRFAAALLLTAALAGAAQRLGAVTPRGAMAGASASLLLFLGGGPGAFAGLTTVFLLTWISTRWGYERKLRLGVAEKREGRSASQVLANTAVAALLAAVSPFAASPELWLAGAVAALAEAAADTVSSELGQAAGGRTWLLTNFRAVAPGTNGGVSLAGTGAGLVAAGMVATTCAAFGVVPGAHAATVTVAAILGMGVDSLLGATFEARGWISNNGVNLAGTLVAAGAALVICNW